MLRENDTKITEERPKTTTSSRDARRTCQVTSGSLSALQIREDEGDAPLGARFLKHATGGQLVAAACSAAPVVGTLRRH